MTTRTEIINGMAIKLGVQQITHPTDQLETARVAQAAWSRVARAELRKQAWSFAIGSTSLGRIADPTGGRYGAAYNLPADLLRIIEFNQGWIVYNMGVLSDGSNTPFAIEGRTLLTNDQTARIRYVRDLSENTALWDAAFVEAFTCRLAVECAPSLTKDKAKAQQAKQDYREAVAEAKRTNGIELPPQEVPDGSWAVSRLT